MSGKGWAVRGIIGVIMMLAMFLGCYMQTEASEVEDQEVEELHLTDEHLEEKEAFEEELNSKPLTITPFWLYMTDIHTSFVIIGGKGVADYFIGAVGGVTKISIYCYLQKYDTAKGKWVDRSSQYKTYTGSHGGTAHEFGLSSYGRGKYRNKYYIYVYKGSADEEVIEYGNTVTY